MSAWSEIGSFRVDGAFKRNACLAAMRLQWRCFGRGKMYLGTIYRGEMYQAVKPDSKGNLVAVEERLKHFWDFNALITNLF